MFFIILSFEVFCCDLVPAKTYVPRGRGEFLAELLIGTNHGKVENFVKVEMLQRRQ